MAFTRAQVVTQFQRVLRWYDRLLEWGSRISGNVVVTQSGVNASVNGGNYAGAVTGAFEAQRAQIAAAASNRALLNAHLAEWADFLDTPTAGDGAATLDEMYRWCIDNNERLAPRGLNFAAPVAAGGNVGSGTIRRLTVDDRNFNLGPAVADAYEARCLTDAGMEGGQRNQEVFEVRSGSARDALQLTGLGVIARLVCVDPFVSSFLANSSFESRSGTNAAPTALTEWTASVGISAGSMVLVSGTSNVFLPPRNDTEIRRAVRLLASMTLSQRLDRNGATINPYLPVYGMVAYHSGAAVNSGTGTLRIRLGSVSASVAYTAAQTTWGVLELATGTTAYYRSFVLDPLTFSIVNERTTGSVRIDDALLAYWTPIGGTYYFARPGRTPFRAGTLANAAGDSFTWADSGGSAGILLRTLNRLTGRSLPYAVSAGAATISD